MVLEIETSDETTLNGRQVAMPAAGRPSSRYLRLRMAFVSAPCQLRFLHRELGDGRGVLEVRPGFDVEVGDFTV